MIEKQPVFTQWREEIAAMMERGSMVELFGNVLLLGKAISEEIMSEILKLNLSITQKPSI